MAVRSSNIVAARGARISVATSEHEFANPFLKLLLMLSEHLWALEAWTR